MEVPLPMLFASSYPAGLEEDADDVPPSPTPDPASPSLMASTTFFQRGFLDCAQEALRFLVDEEGMPEDSPVIAGLKQHLVHSTQQFTPTSLAAPAPTHFTFPPSVSSSGGIMRSKHLHGNLSHATQEGSQSHTRFSSSRSESRFAPYTVSSERRLPRAEVEKNSFMSSSQLVPATTTKNLERVLLGDDMISSDDLQGVLRCLQSVQPSPLCDIVQHASTLHPSVPLSSPCGRLSDPVVHSCDTTHAKLNTSSPLDDSGVCADITDEVDGACHSVTDSVRVCGVFDSVSSCGAVVPDSCVVSCAITERVGDGSKDSEAVPLTVSSVSSPPPSCSVFPIVLPSPSLPPSTSPTSTAEDGRLDSNPSTQLSLLSSLSSGTHRLTAPSIDGGVTATRIQSLANEILLLLEEEAEAGSDGDESEEEDDSDSDDSAVDAEP